MGFLWVVGILFYDDIGWVKFFGFYFGSGFVVVMILMMEFVFC